MEAMDAIDKMIAELDREAKEKRQAIETDTKTRIDADFCSCLVPKRTRNQAPFSRSKNKSKKLSARHESANKSSQTRRGLNKLIKNWRHYSRQLIKK